MGAAILSDREAASRVRPARELRPLNESENRYVPSATELEAWRRVSNYARFRPPNALNRSSFPDILSATHLGPLRPGAYHLYVTGNFTGTTDEILQWAAWKWGLDENLLRAQAVNESRWYQDAVGDSGLSYGILQLKSTAQTGTFPLSRESTPFNVDYAGMMLRRCFDGWDTELGNGYAAGDIWGCLGFYYSGRWNDPGGLRYVARVMQRLAAADWEHHRF